jgi:hypothetical protein
MRYKALSKRRDTNLYSFPYVKLPERRARAPLNFLDKFCCHKYTVIMRHALFHNSPIDGGTTDLEEYKDILHPVFTRAALISYSTLNNLKETLPDDARLDRLFLGEVTSHNIEKLKKRTERQPAFNFQMQLRSCFPRVTEDIWKAQLCLHPSDTSLRDLENGPLRLLDLPRGQRLAIWPLHADKSDLTLIPMPDDTNTLRLYLLGNECNLHSPVMATMILQVR